MTFLFGFSETENIFSNDVYFFNNFLQFSYTFQMPEIIVRFFALFVADEIIIVSETLYWDFQRIALQVAES